MDVFEAIEKRESIRSFTDEQLTDAELSSILRAAERCPRIGSLSIIVLQSREKIDEISAVSKTAMIQSGGWNRSRAQTPGYEPLYGAPTVIMICGYPGDQFELMTTGLAMGMMVMAATALGLGSVTVSSIRHGFGGFKGEELRKLAGISRGMEPLLSLAVGHTRDRRAHEMKGASKNSVKIVK